MRSAAALALALFLLLPGAAAQSFRVATWNLETPATKLTNSIAANTNGIRIPAAAKALKQLNPDVILLQQVRDWNVCDQLAQALKPAKYNVVACSAFPDAKTGELRKQQVAILAKTKAYFSWTEAWRSKSVPALPGGYAFAAFHVGQQQVGVFCVQAAPTAASQQAKKPDPERQPARSAAAAGQLLEQVGSVSNWVANQVQVFVVGGAFGATGQPNAGAADAALGILENAGFGDAFLAMPAAERITMPGRAGGRGTITDYLYTQPAGCTINPRILAASGFRHYPVACDVELGPAAAIAAQAVPARAAPARTPEPKPVTPTEPEVKAAAADPTLPPLPVPAPERPVQSAAEIAPVPAASPVTNAAKPVVAASQPPTLRPDWPWVGAGAVGIASAAALLWLAAFRRRNLTPKPPALLTAGTDLLSSYTMVVGTRSATEAASTHASNPPAPQPIIHVEAPGATQTQAEALRQRAQNAEQRAARAEAVLRDGLIPHLGQWLKQKLVRKIVADRAHMIETQHAAARKAIAVEARLARIEQQVQQQNNAYQVRIEELTRQLLTAKEENRELIRARIAQVKAEMEAARTRLMEQSEAD